MENLTTLKNEELMEVIGGGWASCIAGTAGSAVLGVFTGMAAGSSVPVIGTTAGGVIMGIGGALTGAAATC